MHDFTTRYRVASIDVRDDNADAADPRIATIDVGILSVGTDEETVTDWNDQIRRTLASTVAWLIGRFNAFNCDDLEPQPYLLMDADMAHWVVLGVRMHRRTMHGVTMSELSSRADTSIREVKSILADLRRERLTGKPAVPQASADLVLQRLLVEVRRRLDAAADAREDDGTGAQPAFRNGLARRAWFADTDEPAPADEAAAAPATAVNEE